MTRKPAFTAQKENYETVTEQVRIRESNAEIRLNVSRSPVVTLSADNDRIVAGETVGLSVRDEYGDPIEGATVRLDGDPVGETDAEGRFASGPVEQDDYRVTVRREGYFAEERVVEVVGKSEARFPLERGSVTLTFRVTDDHFDPPRPVEGGSK